MIKLLPYIIVFSLSLNVSTEPPLQLQEENPSYIFSSIKNAFSQLKEKVKSLFQSSSEKDKQKACGDIKQQYPNQAAYDEVNHPEKLCLDATIGKSEKVINKECVSKELPLYEQVIMSCYAN